MTVRQFRFDSSQPRDDQGRWTTGGGGSGGGAGTKDDPFRTGDVTEAARALSQGLFVQLDHERKVSTLVKKLAEQVNAARKAGEDPPNINLCNVSVPGTNLFCAQSKGIPRIQMPQLSGVPTAGSKADALPKDDRGEVNLGPAFVEHLQAQGIAVTPDRVDARFLKASQNELVGAKVAGIAEAIENGTLPDTPIFVTSDDYVVDGHHRWAAAVAVELGGVDADMAVNVIDSDIISTLAAAYDFAEDWGIPPKAAKPDKLALFRYALALLRSEQFHAEHDQSTHGNRGGAASGVTGNHWDRDWSTAKLTQVPIAGLIHRQFPDFRKPKGQFDMSKMDPIKVVRRGSSMYIMDGHHRVGWAIDAGYSEIPALVLSEDDEDELAATTVTFHAEHDQSAHGRRGGRASSAAAILNANPERIPLSAIGIEAAPADLARIAESTRDDAAWEDVPVTQVRSDAKFYGTETDVGTKHVRKVVSGDEPLREGYAPRLYQLDDGYLIADGHHRLAMHVLMGTTFGAHVRRLPDTELSTVIEQFHMRGQHDQKSHGSRGGGATIFDSLEGFDLTAATQRATEIRAHAEQVEPEITANLSRMIGDSSPADYDPPEHAGHPGELYGYKHRLKETKDIAEKIGRYMVEDNLTFDEAANAIKDAVRYTVHFSEEEFGDRAQSIIDELRVSNAVVKVKNTWPPEKGVPYKGVNAQVTRHDGLRYEVQFHTPGSQAVKDRMHKLYKQQRVVAPGSARWRRLEDEMTAIGNGQPVPRDAVRVFRVERTEMPNVAHRDTLTVSDRE